MKLIKNIPTNKRPAPEGFTGEIYPVQILPKKLQREAHKLILQGHHHPGTKTRQGNHKKRKLQANITDEYRCKNPQQNTSKQNLTTC